MCPHGRPRGQGRPRGHHLCYIATDIKKTAPKIIPFKKLTFRRSIWRVSGGGGIPKLCPNICLLNINGYQKKIGTLA